MIQLDLTFEEEQQLKEEMTKRLDELDHEIAHTDSANFKDVLKRRREVVQKVFNQLPDVTAIKT